MTRGLREILGDNDVRKAVQESIRDRLPDTEAPDVVVLTDGAFDFDDVDVVEIRLIFNDDLINVTVAQTAALRGDLFDVFARSGDDRIPLIRLISKSDYAAGRSGS